MSESDLRERVPSIAESLTGLRDLLAVWKTDASTVEVPVIDGGPLTGIAVYVLAQHAVALTQSVILLVESQMYLQAVPLIRLTMECGMTAAWLSVAPNAGNASYHESERNRREIIRALFEDPALRDEEVLAEVEEKVRELAEHRDASAQYFKTLCNQIVGGEKMYVSYRILSGYSHAGMPLVEPYLKDVPKDKKNASGVVLLEKSNYGSAEVSLGYQVAMLCLAMTAWDNLTKGEKRRDELNIIASRFGIGRVIELRNGKLNL
jgi:hypothetical protein